MGFDDLDASKLSDRELLVATYTNVKNLDKKLEGHIADDKELKEKVIVPLWTKHQQNIGAQQAEDEEIEEKKERSTFRQTAINMVFSAITAVAAVMALK